MNEEMITKLKKIAARETWFEDEDFNPMDFSGGNFDDAYYGGLEDGRVDLAREILTSMNIKWRFCKSA
jgi:hypothetical protein